MQRKTALGEQVDIVFIIPIYSFIAYSKSYSVATSFQSFEVIQERKTVIQCLHYLPSDGKNGVRIPQGLASALAALAPCIACCMFAPG